MGSGCISALSFDKARLAALAQLEEALGVGVEAVLLDNMSLNELGQASR
jgi:nicotinate-nucleotide pyrophosphorylase